MGHEAVRSALVQHLQANVPVALGAIRSDSVPLDPRAYLAQDHMPEDDRFPAVCVASTNLLGIEFPQSNLTGPVRSLYAVEVACFVVGDAHKADARTSMGRDRLVEAMRQTLLGVRCPGLSAVHRETYSERTTPVVVDPKGRLLGQGVVSFNVSADEVITGPPGVTADPRYTLTRLP